MKNFVAVVLYSMLSVAWSQSLPTVMIILFEPQMFHCEIADEIHRVAGWDYKEITYRFRSALDQNLYLQLKKRGYTPVTLYEAEETRHPNEQGYIYQSMAYDYELVNNKGEVIEKPSQGIREGEIQIQPIDNEKQIKVVITNPNLIPTLNKTYHAHYYLFIAEMDVFKPAYQAYEDNKKYLLKVHYTLYNQEGKLVDNGLVKHYFLPKNHPEKIFRQEFPVLSEMIINHIRP